MREQLAISKRFRGRTRARVPYTRKGWGRIKQGGVERRSRETFDAKVLSCVYARALPRAELHNCLWLGREPIMFRRWSWVNFRPVQDPDPWMAPRRQWISTEQCGCCTPLLLFLSARLACHPAPLTHFRIYARGYIWIRSFSRNVAACSPRTQLFRGRRNLARGIIVNIIYPALFFLRGAWMRMWDK